jgi:hypothetical protein
MRGFRGSFTANKKNFNPQLQKIASRGLQDLIPQLLQTPVLQTPGRERILPVAGADAILAPLPAARSD